MRRLAEHIETSYWQKRFSSSLSRVKLVLSTIVAVHTNSEVIEIFIIMSTCWEYVHIQLLQQYERTNVCEFDFFFFSILFDTYRGKISISRVLLSDFCLSMPITIYFLSRLNEKTAREAEHESNKVD